MSRLPVQHPPGRGGYPSSQTLGRRTSRDAAEVRKPLRMSLGSEARYFRFNGTKWRQVFVRVCVGEVKEALQKSDVPLCVRARTARCAKSTRKEKYAKRLFTATVR
ncbi:hypothetical protein VZT92_010632 [Zoarces viviparus]|uniref:Uncharacterized protein n=1 Tax=Zoarces viviparus TaxID=48416 RepID=A0AAW1F9M6_ZOAVI